MSRFGRRRDPGVESYRYGGGKWTHSDEERLAMEWVNKLGPGGIDVGTGAALDTYIEHRKREWNADLESYCEGSMARFDKAEAKTTQRLEYAQGRAEPGQLRVEHARNAFAAARKRLTGKDEEDQDWQRSNKPGPGYEGYANPALGRSRGGSAVYIGLLVLAAAADLVAFYQVMGLVLRGQTNWALWPATVGFTAVALGLAHLGGRFHRGLKAGEKGVSAWMVGTAITAWAVLGAGAFLLRLLIPEARNESNIRLEGDLLNTGGEDVGPEELWSRAVVLLILYIATGAIAYIGAYLLHNPLHAEYNKAAREYSRAVRSASRSKAALTAAETRHRQFVQAKERERRRWDLERERSDARFEDIKEKVRLDMASRGQDPSTTSGLTDPASPSRHTGLPPYNGSTKTQADAKERE